MRQKSPTTSVMVTKEEAELLQKGLATYQAYKSPANGHGTHAQHEPMTHSVRTAHYKGHDIEVRTQYELLLDGEAVKLHVEVANDGTVHCHGLPNYSFASSIGMMQKVIDMFSRELPKDELGRKRGSKPKATSKRKTKVRKATKKKTTKRKE